jgi:hypothetical protein
MALIYQTGRMPGGQSEDGHVWDFLEPMTGIEPAYSAWEADVLPLNYIGMLR